MTEKIICAGSGGQGIMVMGKFLSTLALETGKFTTYLPAYGAEVRGGTAHCMVVISDKEIFSPFVDKADTAIIMNEPSLEKFKNRLKKGGVLLLNKSLIGASFGAKGADIRQIPFTQIATDLGNIKCANTVALGAYLAIRKIADANVIDAVLDKMLAGLSTEIVKVNRAALKEGMRSIKNDG